MAVEFGYVRIECVIYWNFFEVNQADWIYVFLIVEV